MEASNVYYTDFRCPVGTSLLEKLRRLCLAAGIRQLDMDGKFVAIKMHFGELGNLAFLRPNYAKVRAYDRDGNEFEVEGEELMARCFCHELDHLDGIVYTEIMERYLTEEEMGESSEEG